MNVFFYGLFMDEELLAAKGIVPRGANPGFVAGYGLCIGERATLVPRSGSRAYGIVMDIDPDEATRLYTEASVADYVPEPVTVEIPDGRQLRATCYNLPEEKVAGANRAYASALLALATRLEFPEAYLDQIRRA